MTNQDNQMTVASPLKTIFTAVFTVGLLAGWAGMPGAAMAGKTNVAVAANFTAAAKDIAAVFEKETGHKAVLSFGSTGKFYTQIVNGAPFEVLLAADTKIPAKTMAQGLGVEGTAFTYAIGKLVLYSGDPTMVDGEGKVLSTPGKFTKLAVANPKTAPYGAAAVEAMEKLGVYGGVKDKIVQGENIAQTYQFVATANAQLGFVALSQIIDEKKGSKWLVPSTLYTPIEQDALLLKSGADSDAAKAFLAFLKADKARAIVEKYGYGIE